MRSTQKHTELLPCGSGDNAFISSNRSLLRLNSIFRQRLLAKQVDGVWIPGMLGVPVLFTTERDRILDHIQTVPKNVPQLAYLGEWYPVVKRRAN